MDDDDAPLAVPLFEPSPEIPAGNDHPLAESPGQVVTNGDGVDGQAQAVGITMITGYLGAGKTTVSVPKPHR